MLGLQIFCHWRDRGNLCSLWAVHKYIIKRTPKWAIKISRNGTKKCLNDWHQGKTRQIWQSSNLQSEIILNSAYRALKNGVHMIHCNAMCKNLMARSWKLAGFTRIVKGKTSPKYSPYRHLDKLQLVISGDLVLHLVLILSYLSNYVSIYVKDEH